ncbi:uncharacterized protein LOC119109105 [Pollicipes pollicipes]|uniref:uncharacterized protein LOC119109105 n=1 Tax=Pollicipes pollicipes TaxID=41117 RepID=UPI001884A207|nr:uncharacterized protein LOC119109105 [Pollicipes pollicipes]
MHNPKNSTSNQIFATMSNQTRAEALKKSLRPEVSNKNPGSGTSEPSPTPKEPKVTGLGVWRKLGEIFDISPKVTADKLAEPTAMSTSSPNPLQSMVPAEESIKTAPLAQKGGSRDSKAQSEQSSKSTTKEDRPYKSALRAAIVDRLLQDLRKMSSAKGSEMARAESDLIEILHDYQTDLMDDDEHTIAGEPFQGVRIHDNVAIPVVYQAVPIKMEGLTHHRIMVRSSRPRGPRHHSTGRRKVTFNPP